MFSVKYELVNRYSVRTGIGQRSIVSRNLNFGKIMKKTNSSMESLNRSFLPLVFKKDSELI